MNKIIWLFFLFFNSKTSEINKKIHWNFISNVFESLKEHVSIRSLNKKFKFMINNVKYLLDFEFDDELSKYSGITTILFDIITKEQTLKVDFGENIFDEGKEITVSVPEDYQGDNFGGSNIVKEDNPSGGNEESPDPSKGNDGDPLDGGAIAGIVIAVVVVIAAICIGVFLYLKKKNTSSASSGSSSSSGEAKV